MLQYIEQSQTALGNARAAELEAAGEAPAAEAEAAPPEAAAGDPGDGPEDGSPTSTAFPPVTSDPPPEMPAAQPSLVQAAGSSGTSAEAPSATEEATADPRA